MGTVQAIPTWENAGKSLMKSSSLWHQVSSGLVQWKKRKYSMDVKDYVKKEIRLTKILTNEVNSELVRTYNEKQMMNTIISFL